MSPDTFWGLIRGPVCLMPLLSRCIRVRPTLRSHTGELREASEAVRRDFSVLAAANPLLERCAPDATVRSMVLAYLGDVYGAPLPALSLKGSTQ